MLLMVIVKRMLDQLARHLAQEILAIQRLGLILCLIVLAHHLLEDKYIALLPAPDGRHFWFRPIRQKRSCAPKNREPEHGAGLFLLEMGRNNRLARREDSAGNDAGQDSSQG